MGERQARRPRDAGLCHSDSSNHKMLKDVKCILGVELIGLVNELKVRNEEKWDFIKSQMDGVATYQTLVAAGSAYGVAS